jgi:glycogen synthase
VIGNIAGTRIYNLPNQQVGYIFSSINHSEMLNTIRKNIALISRNIPYAQLIDPANNFDFFLYDSADYDTTAPGWIWPPGKKTIIIK